MATYTGFDGASGTAFTIVAGGLTITAGGLTVTAGAVRLSAAGATFLGLGTVEAATLACNAVTITKPYASLTGESSMADQLDTLTYASVVDGDVVLLGSAAAGAITVDDANIDLGAATRVISAAGHYLGLIYDGTTFGELFWVQGDNVT
jgi:hypothetical protein